MVAALNLLVLFCVIAFVNCQTCEVAEPIDPLAGIDLSDDDIEKNPYPEQEIAKELKEDGKARGAILQAAASSLAASKLELVPIVSKYSSDLCQSKFVTHYPRRWTYIDPRYGSRCWILNYWWNTPLSYATCPKQRCSNLPCKAHNYYCTASNYKIYAAWSWCGKGGFRYRKFKLPQCCECKRYKC